MSQTAAIQPNIRNTGARVAQVAAGLLVLAGLYGLSRYSYVLFHTIDELFAMVVAGGVFAIAWNARGFFKNSYLQVLAMALLSVAVVDLLHTLSYNGLALFSGYDNNLPTQLWLVARMLQVLAFLLAPLLINRAAKPWRYLAGFAILAIILLVLVFTRIFPDALVTGSGLTRFKVYSEYAMCVLLLAALALLVWRRRAFDPGVSGTLAASIIALTISELLFTLYNHPDGLANMAGHLMKLVAFYLIYKAVIETALARPYSLLFRELKASEEGLRNSEANQRRIADVLQDIFLEMPREVPGVAFGHLYQPASTIGRVGGDFYDLFRLPDGRIAFTIGDVSGHGLEAAALTTLSKNSIRSFAFEGHSPEVVLKNANTVITQSLGEGQRVTGQFVTVCHGVIDKQSMELTYCSAGHPPAFIRRASGDIVSLEVHSSVLGVFQDARYELGCERLSGGDLLLLYTDGLIEARTDSQLFGEQRLLALLQSSGRQEAHELPVTLHARILEFCAGKLQDDMAILAISL